jgi:hypothetical protein
MSADSPWALPVSVDQETPSVNLAPPTDGSGAVVALVAEAGARSRGWAPRVAVSLAREWAGDGLKVFLADGDLDRPALHRILSRGNEEGMADAVMYGASPGRIGQPVPEGGFLFASAGTVVADPGEAWAHPRWGTLLDAFRESGSLLLLYLPAGDGDGLGALIGQADRVIRLADEAPAEDPRTGHLYIHPAEGTLAATPGPGDPPVAGFDMPASRPAGVEDEPAAEVVQEPADPGDLPFADDRGAETPDETRSEGLSFAHEVPAEEPTTGGDFALPEEPVEELPVEVGEAPLGDFTLPDEPEEEAAVEESVIGDFSLPDEEEEPPAAGYDMQEEAAGGEDDLLDPELVVGDDFPSGDDSLDPNEEVWTGTGELQITDEWAGDGPTALGDDGRPVDPGTGAAENTGDDATPPHTPDEVPGGPGMEPGPGTLQGFEGSVPPPAMAAPTEAAGDRASSEPPRPPSPRPEPAPRPPVRARPVERSLSPWLLIILLVIVAALGIASWLGYFTIPGLSLGLLPGDLGMGGTGLPPSSPAG